jgi:hypothetical protein
MVDSGEGITSSLLCFVVEEEEEEEGGRGDAALVEVD